MGMPTGGFVAAHENLALGRRQQSGDALEEGGFAGPVRTDQAAQFAGLELEVDVIGRHHAAEAQWSGRGFPGPPQP